MWVVTSESAANPYIANELLTRLVGCRLYSVQFVVDCVQLRFDGPTTDMPVINCDVRPAVETKRGRDTLRSLIGQDVRSTAERTGVGLRLTFDGGTIVIHPAPADLTGPEIAYLSGFQDGSWMCWRPGEDSVEDLT